jgi:hypothetical protein
VAGVSLKLDYNLAAVERIQKRIDEIVGFDRRSLLEVAAETVEVQVRAHRNG